MVAPMAEIEASCAICGKSITDGDIVKGIVARPYNGALSSTASASGAYILEAPLPWVGVAIRAWCRFWAGWQMYRRNFEQRRIYIEHLTHCLLGAPPFPECPHEGQRLEIAVQQAMERWSDMQRIRDWVLNHARNQIITTFHELRAMRVEAHRNYLHTLPCYTLYQRYNGAPPLQPAQVQLIHSQIAAAQQILQQGVDQDWRTSCMQYPQVLDYYFNLVDVGLPSEQDPAITAPIFGGGRPREREARPRRVKEKPRRDSVDMRDVSRERRRRSRTGHTPPPAPMPGPYRR